MECSICRTPYPDLSLKQVCVSGERTLSVCDDCICDAVSQYLDAVPLTPDTYCREICESYDHGCTKNLTVETCHA